MADEDLDPGMEDETVEKTAEGEEASLEDEPLEELREVDKEEDDLEVAPPQGPNKVLIGVLGLIVFVALFVFFKGEDDPEEVVDLTINAPLPQDPDLDLSQVPSEELARETPQRPPEPVLGEVLIADEMPLEVEAEKDSGVVALSDDEMAFFNPLEGGKEKKAKEKPRTNKKIVKKVKAPIPSHQKTQRFAEGVYSVQVGAFTDLAAADKLVSSLERKGFQAFVLNKGDRFFRVRVGNFQFKQEARSLVAQIKSRVQLPSFVAAN